MCSAPLGNYQLLEAKNSLEMEFWALDNLAVLDRVSIAVKRHHDQGNSYKGQHFRGSVHYHHGGNMVASRQTQCWRRSQEFYILI